MNCDGSGRAIGCPGCPVCDNDQGGTPSVAAIQARNRQPVRIAPDVAARIAATNPWHTPKEHHAEPARHLPPTLT